MRWAQRKTIYDLEGIRLRSCRLWLDAKGFHPFLDQDELIKPDLEKSMGCKYEDLPKEAWDMMDIADMELARRSKYARK
jgi:hypothetical protein